MPVLALLGLIAVLWFVSWAVIQHRGWSWLPVAATLGCLPLFNRPVGQLYESFQRLTDYFLLLGGLVLGLFLASRLASLAPRVILTTLFVPVIFAVTYVFIVALVVR